ncbi:neuropeptide SIFamide [Leptinotarsa decemlineata]|uniref:neuropeptide SIFamide n=1 Tax=Leptinotarsa decemlineata TaxID=7539 RepID=UPI003D30B9FE
MQQKFGKVFACLCVAVLILGVLISVSDAAYRRPPFNGSIFGKRTGTSNEYDNAGKALSAMCEIANEACQSWFPTQEK